MATITLRLTKGSPLTVTEIDDNFNNLNTAKAELNEPEFIGGYIKLPVGDISERPVTPEDGMIRYNDETLEFEGYKDSEWGSLGGGGFKEVVITSTNTAAVKGNLYVVTAGAITLTLPSSPESSDYVGISNRSGTTTSIVARNGSNIMGEAEDLTLDIVDAGITLYYSDVTNGWIIM